MISRKKPWCLRKSLTLADVFLHKPNLPEASQWSPPGVPDQGFPGSGLLSRPRHAHSLTVLLLLEAVFVAAAAAVPEARAFLLTVVKEPHHGVVPAAAGVLVQETGVWMKTGERLRKIQQHLMKNCFLSVLLHSLLCFSWSDLSHPDRKESDPAEPLLLRRDLNIWIYREDLKVKVSSSSTKASLRTVMSGTTPQGGTEERWRNRTARQRLPLNHVMVSLSGLNEVCLMMSYRGDGLPRPRVTEATGYRGDELPRRWVTEAPS